MYLLKHWWRWKRRYLDTNNMDPIGNQMDNGMKWSSLSIEDSVNLIMHDSYTLGRLMMLNSLYICTWRAQVSNYAYCYAMNSGKLSNILPALSQRNKYLTLFIEFTSLNSSIIHYSEYVSVYYLYISKQYPIDFLIIHIDFSIRRISFDSFQNFDQFTSKYTING